MIKRSVKLTDKDVLMRKKDDVATEQRFSTSSKPKWREATRRQVRRLAVLSALALATGWFAVNSYKAESNEPSGGYTQAQAALALHEEAEISQRNQRVLDELSHPLPEPVNVSALVDDALKKHPVLRVPFLNFPISGFVVEQIHDGDKDKKPSEIYETLELKKEALTGWIAEHSHLSVSVDQFDALLGLSYYIPIDELKERIESEADKRGIEKNSQFMNLAFIRAIKTLSDEPSVDFMPHMFSARYANVSAEEEALYEEALLKIKKIITAVQMQVNDQTLAAPLDKPSDDNDEVAAFIIDVGQYRARKEAFHGMFALLFDDALDFQRSLDAKYTEQALKIKSTLEFNDSYYSHHPKVSNELSKLSVYQGAKKTISQATDLLVRSIKKTESEMAVLRGFQEVGVFMYSNRYRPNIELSNEQTDRYAVESLESMTNYMLYNDTAHLGFNEEFAQHASNIALTAGAMQYPEPFTPSAPRN